MFNNNVEDNSDYKFISRIHTSFKILLLSWAKNNKQQIDSIVHNVVWTIKDFIPSFRV